MMQQMKLSVRALEARARNGFASRSPEARRALAIKAGQAAQASGRAHRWTADEARQMAERLVEQRWQRFKEETR